MAAAPKYIQRLARLPQVFELLAGRPDGLPLTELAAAVGTSPTELREDLLVFYAAESKELLFGLGRPDVLEFCAADGSDDDPSTAEVVRIVGDSPAEELGVEYLDAAELALIYTSAQALREIEPTNEDLAGAIEVLTQTLLGEPAAGSGDAGTAGRRAWDHALEPVRTAIDGRRRVRITYSPAWSEGVRERDIEPWRLVQTRRGWEVDAGPVTDDGSIRTYLLSHIRSLTPLDATFEVPVDAEARIEAQRATTPVRVRIPHAARWAADYYAERVTVVADDELTATLDLELLPPVTQRIGLLLLVAGEDAQVLQPSALVAAGPETAAALLAHHRG